MANRRSLIGEVSLPKISEKVWNRGYTEVDDGYLSHSFDYALTSDLSVISSVSGSANVTAYTQTLKKGNTHYTPKGLSLGIETFKILSWTPLEDDNYKYIVFPMHLEVGDNGDKGKVLFEYLSSLENKIIDEMYIGTIKIHNFNVISDRQCYLYPSQGDSYQLNIDGVITKMMTEPV